MGYLIVMNLIIYAVFSFWSFFVSPFWAVALTAMAVVSLPDMRDH